MPLLGTQFRVRSCLGLAVTVAAFLIGCSMDTGFDVAGNRAASSRNGNKKYEVFDFVKECGLAKDKMDDDNAVVLQQSFTSLPIKIEGVDKKTNVAFSVTTVAKLNISSTKSRATQTVNVSVLDTQAKAPSNGGLMGAIVGLFAPGVVKSKADASAQENSGTTTSDALPQKDWLHLVDGGNAQFKGLLCAGQGGKTATIQQGKDTVVVEFSPALINSVSPLAPVERLRQEMGETRTFNITANVQGGGAEYAKGAVQGRTIVREIEPTFNCQGTTRTADIAYEFTNEFPGGAYKVGLPKKQVMYIDSKNKKFVAIINQDDKVDEQVGGTLPPVCLLSD